MIINSVFKNWEKKFSNDSLENFPDLIGEDLIKLTGFYGFYDKWIAKDKFNDDTLKYSFKDNHQEINFKLRLRPIKNSHRNGLVLNTIFDFESKKIFNALIKSHLNFKTLGSDIFTSQVFYAQKQGFKEISLEAYGSFAELKEYSGYIVWAKLGFLMHDCEKKAFGKFMVGLQKKYRFAKEKKFLKARTLNELITITEDSGDKIGELEWIENGYTWRGYFDLNPNSKSIEILNAYNSR